MMENKKTYLVIWTYVANFSSRPLKIQASSPEEARDFVLNRLYPGDDFRKRGQVYVVEGDFACTHNVNGSLEL